MINDKDLLIRTIAGAIIIGLLMIISFGKPHDMVPPPIQIKECNEDSLKQVIVDLQIELENEENGWDSKEKRYEDILFEYEFGIDRLKHSHPEAFREFHRIIAYKENYSREVERENEKRLKVKKW
jgi:hypothetical protein